MIWATANITDGRDILRVDMGFYTGIILWRLLKASSRLHACPFRLPVILTVAQGSCAKKLGSEERGVWGPHGSFRSPKNWAVRRERYGVYMEVSKNQGP